MAQVQVRAPQAQSVAIGGTPVDAMVGPLLGGYIVNPLAAADQGLPFAEALYVDLVGPAALAQTATTSRLLPGQYFTIPATAGRVSVNALSSGHQFSAYVLRSATQFPPVPAEGTFPPSEPTSLQQIIPAYLYQEYQDDPDLQAFWAAYNTLAQQYVNWFLQIGLPIYTGPLIVGPLLDWIAQGLYGIARPTLFSGKTKDIGPLNTWPLNSIAFNARKIVGPQTYYVTTDDIFKRVITWLVFRGDGKVFNIRWLKRRVMRFLNGVNGTSYAIDNTYQVSVSFGVDGEVTIRLIGGLRKVTGGALFNRFALNTTAFNAIRTSFTPYAPLANALTFQEAVDAGVLELPFQFDFTVIVS